MTASPAKISTAFRPLYTSKKRYFLLTGGRGSLKSSTVHDFVARLTYESGHGILFTRYTLTSAELSIIPEFRTTLQRLGIESDFKITKQTITNRRTGSFIYFSGIKTSSGNQTAKLKSIAGITTWIIEEGEDFHDEKAFDDIDNSIRTTTRQNRIIWIQNPTTHEHFIYKRFVEPNNRQLISAGFRVTVSNMPQVEHIHVTYHLAESLGYLEKSWLEKTHSFYSAVVEKIQRTTAAWTKSANELALEINRIWYTSYFYYTYIGGWLERQEGAIFDNWIEDEFDNSLPYAYGLDFGYSPDPLACIKVAVDKKRKRIYIKQILYEIALDDVPGALDNTEVKKTDLIVCDTNEPRTQKHIKKAGYNIQSAIKLAGSIAEDIREIKTYLIVVDPGSKDAKTELNNYIWNDKKASIPIDAFNHLMDGMRYAFRRLVVGKRRGTKRVN